MRSSGKPSRTHVPLGRIGLVACILALGLGVKYFPYSSVALSSDRRRTVVVPTEDSAVWSGLVGVSKDRRKIVFAVHAPLPNRSPTSVGSFWRLDVETGRVKILEEGYIITSGAWTYLEKSERVIFRSNDHRYDPSADLCVVDLKGKRKVLARSVAREFLVSADERFVFYTDAPTQARPIPVGHILDLRNPKEPAALPLSGPLPPSGMISFVGKNHLLLRQPEDTLTVIDPATGRRMASFTVPRGRTIYPHVSVSADRKSICFSSHPDGQLQGPDEYRIVRIATADGLEIVKEFEGFIGGAWSPDGRFLILNRAHWGSDEGESVFSVWDTETEDVFELVAKTDYEVAGVRSDERNVAYVLSETWSSQGPQVLAMTRERDLEAGVDGDIIFVLDLDRREVVQEYREAFYPHRFAWSPDGRYLATKSHYISGNDEVSHGWILDVENGDRTQLALGSVDPVLWLDPERILWVKRQPIWGRSIPRVEFFTSALGRDGVERLYPR